MEPVIGYLSLGSNLGRREGNLATAIQLLDQEPDRTSVDRNENGSPFWSSASELRVLRASSVYQTQPWGVEDQPDFLNCVLEVSIRLSPPELLEYIKEIEESMGRKPSLRYGPRLIDIDILFYGDIILDRPDLQIPHPRLHQRAFVLVPLVELNQGLIHPILNTSVGDLNQRVDGGEDVLLWRPPIQAIGKDCQPGKM